MRVELFPADKSGCGKYRMIWPAAAINQQGLAEVAVHHADSTTSNLPAQLKDINGVTHVVGVGKRDWPDVVVLQRPLNRLLATMIPHLKAAGVAVVVELDDDFRALSPAHMVYDSVQPHRSPNRNWEWLKFACHHADLVTVSTKNLARAYGRIENTVVIRNYVPSAYLDLPISTMDDGVRVVWSGNIDTHPNDLQVTRGAVQRALGKTTFEVIGTGHRVQEALQLRDIPPTSGVVQMDDYAATLAPYDLMIVPLEITPFNHSKSWLKGLEAAAVGMDVVASPTEPYCELHEMGMCELARKPKMWEGILKSRIQKLQVSGYREELAEAQRARVRAAGLIIEERAYERVAAWQRALDSRVRSHA